jgi:hypothetical protein
MSKSIYIFFNIIVVTTKINFHFVAFFELYKFEHVHVDRKKAQQSFLFALFQNVFSSYVGRR